MHKSLASRYRLSNPRRRVLQAISDLGGRHVTINQLAERLGGHPNAARPHLGVLSGDGLVTIADIPGSGPGRRPRGHTITDAGRDALAPNEASNANLAGAFASYLVRTGRGPEERSGTESIGAVLEVLDMLGFDPGRVRTVDGDALVLRTCPLVGADHDARSSTCTDHHGMIDGVLRRIGATEGLSLLPFTERDDRVAVAVAEPAGA